MGAIRIIVLAVAAIAAGGTALLVRGLVSDSNEATANTPREIVQMPTTEVLVAAGNLERGDRISVGSLRWQPWPEDGLSPMLIVRSRKPKALEDTLDSVVRVPVVAGEPITDKKVVANADTGFMAAILDPGMRAVSTKISAETGAGGFILPNDRVDVIVTEQKDGDFGTEITTSATILKDVRILAIDQTYRETEEKQVVVGKTATLELSPRQSEVLSRASKAGEISLALRSLSDTSSKVKDEVVPDPSSANIHIYRYGSESVVSVGSAQ